jgi:rare lipoprotein A
MVRALRFLLILCVVLPMAGCAAMGGRQAAPPPAELEARGQVGIASIYANALQGRRTASGDRYDRHRLTAAHRELPFGTRLRVTNLANDRSVIVTVNDRGPFRRGRIVDLSRRAARAIDLGAEGLTRVRVEVID